MEKIQDDKNNITRFLVMGNEIYQPEFKNENYITSFLFKLKSKPAALYSALSGFAINGVNLTKLQSFPEKNSFSSFFFLCDIEGHIEDKKIKNSLEELMRLQKNYLLILFCFFNIYFFNFPQGFGGGIFFHLSNNFFSNNLVLFLVFIISIYVFKAAGLLNFQNFLIFLCLILYNLQISIYHKYYDPLLLFMILFLTSNNIIKNKSIFIEITKKYYYLFIFFLAASFYKVAFL